MTRYMSKTLQDTRTVFYMRIMALPMTVSDPITTLNQNHPYYFARGSGGEVL